MVNTILLLSRYLTNDEGVNVNFALVYSQIRSVTMKCILR